MAVSAKQTVVSPALKSYAKCGKIQIAQHDGKACMSVEEYDCWMHNTQRCSYNVRVLKIAHTANTKQMGEKDED